MSAASFPLTRRDFALAALAAAQATAQAPAQATAQTAAQASSGAATTVAAASDLKFALEELAAHFERSSGHRLRLVFGASGHLTTQILQGAPFHLFLSADETLVFRLADAGLTADRGQVYALGHLVLYVRKGSPIRADAHLHDLQAAIHDGRLKRLAMANPAHAPYGMRARETLQSAGLWERVQPHLVFGENVSQAAQFVASGSAQAGLIAQSLALSPSLREAGSFAAIPGHRHEPLRQRMVLLKSATPAARAFMAYVASAQAQPILLRHGFEMPRERD